MSESNVPKEYWGFENGQQFPDEFWNRIIPMGKRDVVRIGEDDLINGSQPLLLKPADRWKYVETPALPFFTLHIDKAASDDDAEYKYDYEPLPHPLDEEMSYEGVVSVPKLICRLAFRWSQSPGWVPVIGMVFGTIFNPKDNVREPSIKFEWIREGTLDGSVADFAELQMRHALNKYLRVQALLLNRPEIFREETAVRNPAGSSSNSHKNNKRRKVKAYRVLIADHGKIPAFIDDIDDDKEKRSFSCPCWGVIGHVRRYKSGKEVWVKPYVKGKERKKPELYSAKQYEIVKGANG